MMIPLKLIPVLATVFHFLVRSLSASPVAITVSSRSIPKSSDPITIRWSGIDSPSELDWLGIYSPSNSSHADFIGYIFLSSSPGCQSGSGSITIPLINLRSDYQFRIFHWTESEINPKKQDHDHNPLPGTKHLLAESETIRFEPGRGPEQVHLALTGRDGEMRVMFVTHDGKDNSVRYGLARDKLIRVVNTRVSRYEREDMCDSPANESVGWRDPGFIHDGVMLDLKEGKRYYYQVGSDSGGWSSIYTFISPIKDSTETIAFLFGDMGTATPYSTFVRIQEESISTIKWINRDIEAIGDKPALISHVGDISYARGYSWLWDNFFNQIEPIASRVPYHVCIGNHEYDWPSQPWKPDWSYSIYGKDGGGECGVPYSLRFVMPGNSSEPTGMRAPPTRNLYYSFNMGVGHRPMYTTSHETRDKPFRERLLENLEPLLVKNNVTLALWGHVHRYERFCPLSNFTCGTSGPVHMVIGMAGQDWQPIWQPRTDHPNDPIFPQPVRSMYRGGEFGYVRLFADREKLTVSYVGNHDGEVHDVVEILASGRVLNGRAAGNGVSVAQGEWGPRASWYVMVGSILVLGAFVGYVLGFVSRAVREGGFGTRWMAVKSEEA
ncbi:Probable inactive purple acid phosphatase 2 [Striga hermonthica]|uniref:Purple acid phosphatase n=1 Tax=Striga hermonthica TaxID=68872 RepID=A0A9N7N2X3_STRHE|nr:Probable inactive purple acid phosphatase 2 [Striga hermonthica]